MISVMGYWQNRLLPYIIVVTKNTYVYSQILSFTQVQNHRYALVALCKTFTGIPSLPMYMAPWTLHEKNRLTDIQYCTIFLNANNKKMPHWIYMSKIYLVSFRFKCSLRLRKAPRIDLTWSLWNRWKVSLFPTDQNKCQKLLVSSFQKVNALKWRTPQWRDNDGAKGVTDGEAKYDNIHFHKDLFTK